MSGEIDGEWKKELTKTAVHLKMSYKSSIMNLLVLNYLSGAFTSISLCCHLSLQV